MCILEAHAHGVLNWFESIRVPIILFFLRSRIMYQQAIRMDAILLIANVWIFVQGLEYRVILNRHCDWIMLFLAIG